MTSSKIVAFSRKPMLVECKLCLVAEKDGNGEFKMLSGVAVMAFVILGL